MSNVNFFGFDSLFAARLRSLIDSKGISKQQLADAIGVSRQAISQYCDGSTIPNAEKLFKIAEYFDVSLDYLTGRTKNTTIDEELKFVCNYTGLNEKTVTMLKESAYNANVFSNIDSNIDFIYNLHKMVNLMFSDEHFVMLFCSDFINYIDEESNKKRFNSLFAQGNIPIGLDFSNLFLIGMQQKLKEFKDNYISKQDKKNKKQETKNYGND